LRGAEGHLTGRLAHCEEELRIAVGARDDALAKVIVCVCVKERERGSCEGVGGREGEREILVEA